MVHTSKHGNALIPAVLWNIGSVSNPGVSQDIQFRICHRSGEEKDVSVIDIVACIIWWRKLCIFMSC